MHSGRKLLYSAARVHAMFARMKADLVDQHERHLSEYAALRRELDVLRAELDQLRELRAATLARSQAHAELFGLYRERDIVRARHAERDLDRPLH